jgi:hypothetical protein
MFPSRLQVMRLCSPGLLRVRPTPKTKRSPLEKCGRTQYRKFRKSVPKGLRLFMSRAKKSRPRRGYWLCKKTTFGCRKRMTRLKLASNKR